MSKEDWQKNTVDKIFKDLYPKEVDSILDVACGVACKSQYLKANKKVGVDIYLPYLKEAKRYYDGILICYDVTRINKLFLPKSFDIVLLLDILEHLEKNKSWELIYKAEKTAKKAVIIETPLGYVPQDIDILGFKGHKWQTHRSGWDICELEGAGYICKTRNYKMQDVKRHTTKKVNPNIKLIDAIKLL